MATERHISWNEEIQGIEIKTLFFFSLKLIVVNMLGIFIVVVAFGLIVGGMFGR